MVTKLHHVNLCSNNVPEMDRFYREVLDLAPIPGRNEQRVTNEGYSGEVAFVTDGATEVHLAAKDLGISFQPGRPSTRLKRGISRFARMTLQPSSSALRTAASPSPITARGR
jgi:glyoxylase I family protein